MQPLRPVQLASMKVGPTQHFQKYPQIVVTVNQAWKPKICQETIQRERKELSFSVDPKQYSAPTL